MKGYVRSISVAAPFQGSPGAAQRCVACLNPIRDVILSACLFVALCTPVTVKALRWLIPCVMPSV